MIELLILPFWKITWQNSVEAQGWIHNATPLISLVRSRNYLLE